MKHLRIPVIITGMLTCGSCCPGAIVYSGVQNIVIPTTFDGVYLDIDDGSASTAPFTGWDINIFFGGVGIGGSSAFQPVRTGTGVSDAVMRLGMSDDVGGGLLYAGALETGSSDHLGAAGNFQIGEEGYLGFKFTNNEGSGPYYGWMRLTLTANTSGAVIRDWAWEADGSPISAGFTSTVPEPSRAMLALLGAWAVATATCRNRSSGRSERLA